MSFSITLYNTTSPARQAVKQLSQLATVTGNLKAGTSIITPTIERVKMSAPPTGANYMRIDAFGRSYIIDDIDADDVGGFWRIRARCDVLSTYWSQISQQQAILRRQTNEFNLFLPDPSFPVMSYRAPQVLTFPKGFSASMTGACVGLTVAGASFS